MPVTASLSSPHAPSLSDFRTALNEANALKHSELYVNKNGTIASSNPSWLTRVVRFVKARLTRRHALSERSQRHSIDTFRQAIVQERDRRGGKILEQQINISNAHKIPINTSFYEKVLHELDLQDDILATDRSNLEQFVKTSPITEKLDNKTKQKLIDRTYLDRVDHNDVGRVIPLDKQQIKGFVIRASRRYEDLPRLG
ncbi:MAG: hypothetical protein GDA50_08080 [Alphaproteobacteria bacterium GM202ARS2]|nr:hypothetical protein [Alphaproteobacteria bacterium GM202ARS2]